MKLKRPLILSMVFLVNAMLYQNCGQEVSLTAPKQIIPVAPLLAKTLSASVCPVSDTSVSVNSKVVFIVDMSLSNLGGRHAPEYVPISSSPPVSGWQHTLVGAANALDWDGVRFTILDNLIGSLGIDDYKNLSVIGFHDATVFGLGLESCQSDFLNKSNALRAVQNLRNLQNQDKANPSQTTLNPNSPFNLKGTRYKVALDCLRDKIEFDILAGENNEKSFYNVIFLTDGQPEDAANNDFPGDIQELLNMVRPDILGMKLFPVYYGPQGGEEQTNAVNVLNPMARALDPSASTIITDDLPALEQQLLSQLTSSSQINYLLKNFVAINLTATNIDGRLYKDSNMNGIRDSDESNATADIRSIYDQYATNINDDRDLIPSFVERIKRLRVDLKDDTLDLDLDGKSNLEELISGRDILSHEEDFPTPSEYLMRAQAYEDTLNTCSSNRPMYKLDLNQIPLIEDTTGFTDPSPSPGLDFSYEPGENLILIYYIAEPLNAPALKPQIYKALIRVSRESLERIQIGSEAFSSMGDF
jgi:hypothetical protein